MRTLLGFIAVFLLAVPTAGQTVTERQIEHASGPCKLLLQNKELVPPKSFESPTGKIYLHGPLVTFSIRPDGSVTAVKILTPSESKHLEIVAVTSLSKWKYKPRPTQCGTIDSQIIIRPDLLKTEN